MKNLLEFSTSWIRNVALWEFYGISTGYPGWAPAGISTGMPMVSQMANPKIQWDSPWKSHMGFPRATVGQVHLTPPRADSGLAQVGPMWDLHGIARARANPVGPLWPTEIPGGI